MNALAPCPPVKDIPIKFEARTHNEPFTPKIRGSKDMRQGVDFNKAMPWCRHLRYHYGQPDRDYNVRFAQSTFFELAPLTFTFMERKYDFVTAVMMAQYTCFPYVNRPIHEYGLNRKKDEESEYTGLVKVKESARAKARASERTSLIPAKGNQRQHSSQRE